MQLAPTIERVRTRTDTTASVDVPVLYIKDPTDGTWTYVLDHPSVMGGPCASRSDAEAQAMHGLTSVLHAPISRNVREGVLGHLRVIVAVGPPAG
jgi:hypothetical protein